MDAFKKNCYKVITKKKRSIHKTTRNGTKQIYYNTNGGVIFKRTVTFVPILETYSLTSHHSATPQ